MAKTQPKLPSWATWAETERPTILVNVDEVYPMYLGLLKLEPTNYNVGVVRFCITRDLADLMAGAPVIIRFQPSSAEAKENWQVANLEGGEAEYDAGLKAGYRYRKALNKVRAAAALSAE